MNAIASPQKETLVSKNPNVTQAGRGKYVYDPKELQHVQAAPKYSAIEGVWLAGNMIIVGVQGFAPGKSAVPHQHVNEQWNYVLEGSIDITINGVAAKAGPGSVIYIPANTLHFATADEKVGCKLIVIKDTTGDVAPD
jgi:quercetin dioxygenase-like cupin family protein